MTFNIIKANGSEMNNRDNGDIVISGISGIFPQCDNVMELAEKLYSGKNTVSTCNIQWMKELGMPQYLGAVDKWNKFDASFFGMNAKTASSLYPEMRKMLEKTQEAILDSGTNPGTLRGSNTGVFVGMCIPSYSIAITETKSTFSKKQNILLGNHIFANLISYTFDLKGPSYSMDTACSSSSFALAEAFNAIKSGICDAAVVATANICTFPKEYLLHASNDVLLAKDGKCKAFDESGDGFVCAEAVCVMLLQRSHDARRIYAKIANAKCNNDGFKIEGQPHPSREMQGKLLSKFYTESEIDANDISWIETHGTGTVAGDKAEAGALNDVLCKAREEPLRVGSVKSNLGHAEGSAGLVGITKIIISMETGVVPANLHYENPRTDIESLMEGKIEVIYEPVEWDGGYVGSNSFGIGGANCHILLKSNEKLKIESSSESTDIPVAVLVSGRTEDAVETLMSYLESTKVDMEQVRLFHEIHRRNIQGHLYRGYIVLGNDENVFKHARRFSEEERPVWFVFSGMGSQWPKMGKDLMKLPVYAKSIIELHNTLKPHGVDLVQILTEEKEEILASLLNCFVGITAIQIALVDVLRLLSITPDGIIGHSFGEIACAYADGCLTSEQAILCSYYRGKCTTEATDNIEGMMASVGVGFKDVDYVLPEGVTVACHNSSTNCTISGPRRVVEEFLGVLQAGEIFTKEVYTEQIAYHSKYIKGAATSYLNCLQKVIPMITQRSPRWISTSIPQIDWDKDESKCSAEYFTNNLVNPVLFEEASSLIPKNALLIEIAPHAILSSIMRGSASEKSNIISLMVKNQEDNLMYMMSSIGRLYEEGIHPELHNLYPPIEFPVSKGTPMISPLIKWEHSADWPVHKYKSESNEIRSIKISLQDDHYNFLKDHVVDGRNVFPATGYLILVWETFSWMNGYDDYTKFSVMFENIKFIRASIIPKEGELNLKIYIRSHDTGTFEVTEKGVLCAQGTITAYNATQHTEFLTNDFTNDSMDLSMMDIYREFQISGFRYSGLFKAILGMNIGGTNGQIKWNDNYVTFVDSVMQSVNIGKGERKLFVPTSIRKLLIDVDKHSEFLNSRHDFALPLVVSHERDIVQCGGVHILDYKTTKINKQVGKTGQSVLRKYHFVPFMDETVHSLEMAVEVSLNIMIDNLNSSHFTVTEILNDSSDEVISNMLIKYIDDWLNSIQSNITVYGDVERENIDKCIKVQSGNSPPMLTTYLIVMHNVKNHPSRNLRTILDSMNEGSYLLCMEPVETELDLKYMDAVSCMNYKCDQNRMILLRKKTSSMIEDDPTIVKVELDDYEWITRLKNEITQLEGERNKKIVIYSQGHRSGILGFYKCLKKEISTNNLRCFFIQDNNSPPFDVKDKFYTEQISKDCSLNIYKDGAWGTYCHLQMEITENTMVEHAHLDLVRPGDLSSLKWVAGSFHPNRNTRKDVIRGTIFVSFCSLNFRDVLLATGSLLEVSGIAPSVGKKNQIGYECVGTTSDGRRFIGICNGGSFSTQLDKSDFIGLTEIPNDWSLEDAATIGLAYMTVIDMLLKQGNLKKGESILIHSATGSVGQAAINLAIFYECEIYVTVGTQEKKEFIRNIFPQIPERNIGNSRDTSFENMIQERTSGVGVNVVLNSLADDKFLASVRCLARDGRFIEIGLSDILRDNPLGLRAFSEGMTFHSGILIYRENFKSLCDELRMGIDNGWVKPMIRTIFEEDQVVDAFKFLASGNHVGKVLVKLRNEEDVKKEKPFYVKAIPRYLCYHEDSYIICGGLGGIGLEIGLWLTSRGARNIVVSSRNGLRSNYQRYILKKWKAAGANVVICMDDIATEDGAKCLIEKANRLGAVSAIFNLAVVLHDAVYENQTEESFQTVIKAKIAGTSNLDRLSRIMCPSLDKFVVFSSVASGVGIYGQTNYGWANSAAERICEERQSLGFPAIAIQWGLIGDVGIVSQIEQGQDPSTGLNRDLGISQSIHLCLENLDKFLCERETVVSCWIPSDKNMAQKDEGASMLEKILEILGLKDLKNISLQTTLAQSGLDSFATNGLKQMLEKDYDIVLGVLQVRSLTFAKILELSSKDQQISETFGS